MDKGVKRSEKDDPLSELQRLRKEVAQSVEERKNTADRIAASMRLTAIGQLAAGVAHELNNPLSVILGFAQSLARQSGNAESIQVPLKTIEREAQRCRRLVQDLLNFSRLPKPGKVMEDPIQVLEGALPLIESQARVQQVEVAREFDAALPSFYVDRHRIQQMVINLCTNAMDAMPKGGRLTVRLKSAAQAGDGSTVEIAVSDTGTGIAPEIQNQIFEPFFTTKAHGKGTGLGLSLVRDIVNEHEGRLDVSSKVGQGTTFTVTLTAKSRALSKS